MSLLPALRNVSDWTDWRSKGPSSGQASCGSARHVEIGQGPGCEYRERELLISHDQHGASLGAHRVCRPVAHRSKSPSVAMIPNGSCRVRLTSIADPPPVYRGIARVCWPGPMVCRSGINPVAITPKIAMFDGPVMAIASVVWLGWAGWCPLSRGRGARSWPAFRRLPGCWWM